MLAYSLPDARLTVNACRRRGGDPRRTWRFSGGRDSETGSGGGPMWRASERWRSGWDGEFESPLLPELACHLTRDRSGGYCTTATAPTAGPRAYWSPITRAASAVMTSDNPKKSMLMPTRSPMAQSAELGHPSQIR